MTLSPTYELEIGPSPQSIEDYAASTEAQFHQLLDANPSEQHVQNFLEQNPALVPGARTPGSPSGHSPLHNALITQPRLPGLRSNLPDFMWIAFHSLAWFPTLIEIERPDKKIFRSDGVPRAEFTQARNQLAQWRAWFSKPENVLTFVREYGIPEDVAHRRSMRLHMILVYGRRSEFEADSVMTNQRSALVNGADEGLMSFDRMRVDKDLRDTITVRCNGSGEYRAVAVPSTFTLGPTFADRLAHIRGLEGVIRQANIEVERELGDSLNVPTFRMLWLYFCSPQSISISGGHMAIRPRGRQRSLSKKVSSFNMYMDQVYQVRAIMETTGAVKDAPVIRELLDEALAARRRKAAGITDSEEPPGQEITETLHTLQTLLLKLIKREEQVFMRQTVGLKLFKEGVVEARAGREIAFEELVEKPWIAKGKSKETMANFFDMKSRYAREYVDGVIAKIKRDLEAEENKS